MTQRRSTTARSASPATRRARLETFQPDGQITRRLKTRQLPFTGDPRDLIARATRLRPGWDPVGVELLLGRRTKAFPQGPLLIVCFGRDGRGTLTEVTVRLENDDVPVVLRYLERLGGELVGSMFCDYVADEEELSVPRVTVDELAEMPTSALVL